jgi:sec-independent protein translocase protein TatA
MLSGLTNPVHLMILIVIVFILFGAKRVPEMARAMGSGLREFKHGLTDDDDGPPALPEPGSTTRRVGS